MRLTQRWIGLLILTLMASQVSAQNLADFARRERERQRRVESKVFFTNADRPSGRIVASENASEEAAQEPNPDAAESTPTGFLDNQGRDEAFWRAAFQAARDEAKSARDRVAVLQLRLNELRTSLLRDSSVFNRENLIGGEITQVEQSLGTAREEAQAADNKLRDLELDLRRSNGPPGWARP